MASLETRPDGLADSIDRVTALEMRVCELENAQLGLEAQLADADAKVLALEGQQRSDEKQFKAIVKQQRHNQIFQGVMILLAVCGLAGITITEEHQEKLIAAVVTVAVGAVVAPRAEAPDEES